MALAAAPAAGDARELVIDASPCAKTIRIHSRDVPAQEIVTALTNAMGARLVAKTTLSDPVSFDGSGAPVDVLKRLLHDKNLVVETAQKARCGSREVVSTVWLLPVGEDAPARPAAPAVQPAAAPAPWVQSPAGPDYRSYASPLPPKFRRRGGHRMSLEEKRLATQDLRDGKLKVDPDTGELVPVTPSPAVSADGAAPPAR